MVPKNVKLYVGAPIDQQSERDVLKRLLTVLAGLNEPATVFANLHVGGRQLDFVVGLPHLSLILEVKGASLPIRGALNGEWSVTTRGGKPKPARNAYRQALDAKNALADQMRRLGGRLSDYPNACVVFTPAVPAGSELPPTDLKVAIGNIEDLDAQVRGSSSLCLGEPEWAGLAAKLCLRQVNSFESAFDTLLTDAQQTVDRYLAAFNATYGPLARRHVADTYRLGSATVDVGELCDALETRRLGLLIRGPSGCGKSLLSYALAQQLALSGTVPLLIECKSFDGHLAQSLDREASVLDVASASTLLGAARKLSRPIALVADGYNECSATARSRLTRTLRAASVRYDALLIVSSSLEVERSDLLDLHRVEIAAPSLPLKARIAGVDLTTDPLLAPLLEMVTTGLEAALIGQVGRQLAPGSSRFALLDFFVRRKLGAGAHEGVRLLCAIAERLTERIAFSLSLRELDRLLAEKGQLDGALDLVQRSGVLTVRIDRVSFGHEMYLNAFSAESLLRKFSGDPAVLAATLSLPRFSALRVPLIGAIDDEALVLSLLRSTTDAELLDACLRGECGAVALQYVLSVLDAIPARLRTEADQLRFEVTGKGPWNVKIAAGCHSAWTTQDKAMLSVFAIELAQGRRVAEYMEVMTRLDRTLDAEFQRLRPIARGMNLSIRSGMFAVAHLFQHEETAVTLPALWLNRGVLSFDRSLERSIPLQLLESLWPKASSCSELYFVLKLTHIRHAERAAFLPYVIPLLELERWKFLPYHLQLDLLSFVHFTPDVPSELAAPLIGVLEGLLPNLHPFLTQDVFEVLARLGALDVGEAEQLESVRREVAVVLEEPFSPTARQQAWGVYNAQFDHPFSSSYCEVIEGLPPDQRLAFFQMASLGAENPYSFFLSTLIDRLGDSGNVKAAAAIERWTSLPSRTATMPQSEVETFVTAYISMGKLGAALPEVATRLNRGAHEDALTACGLLYYWFEREGTEVLSNNHEAIAAMSVLLQPNSNVAAGMLYELVHSIHHPDGRSRSLIEAFQSQMLTICRRALDRPTVQIGYFAHGAFNDYSAICKLAISVVQKFGDRLDLVVLRGLTDDLKLAEAALAAIKTIEQRMH